MRIFAWLLLAARSYLGLEQAMPVPADNPETADKIALGRRLFSDPALSADRTLACSGCHDPGKAFTDGRPVAVGVSRRKGNRNTPTLINRGYGLSQFWDGRSESLEKQALEPIVNRKELNMTLEAVVARLRTGGAYGAAFQSVFHRDVNAEDLARALACYVRSIRSGGSRFDRYLKLGEDLTPEESEGFMLFRGKGNCTVCHAGPNFSDELFHNTGVAWRKGRLPDLGRFIVSGRAYDRGAFKTPTLRDVARTAPYMHDGSVATLEEVIEFYDRGGRGNPFLDANIGPLRLTAEEKRALIAFLRALTGSDS